MGLWLAVIGFHFLVQLLLIYGTGRLLQCQVGFLRALPAALLGTAQIALWSWGGLAFLGQPYWRVIFLGMTAYFAFRGGGAPWQCGALYAVLQLAVETMVLSRLWAFVPLAAALWLLCRWGLSGQRKTTAAVEIIHRNKKLNLTALVDTGNHLRDPITGLPVLVAGGEAAETLLSLGQDALAAPLETMAAQSVPGLRLIPYTAVGQPQGLLLAIRPEIIRIDGKLSEQILAFSPNGIGGTEGYEALLGGRNGI